MTDDGDLLTPERRTLGARTALLDGAGEAALRRLAATSVLVVGAGGLGAPVLALLAGSGLRRITIVDPDVVDPTNLARQTLFVLADVGAPKAELAAARVRAVDASVEVVAVVGEFAPAQVFGHDVVIDAADSVAVTRTISDACAAAGTPFVWASVLGFDGQVSTFWDAHGIDFHDLHPDPLPDEGSCAVDGVLPALCHAVGAVMAAQVPALIAGLGEPLVGTVLTVDARRWRWTSSPLRRSPSAVRPTMHGASASDVPSIGVDELRAWIAKGDEPVVVDVRSAAERSSGMIPGAVAPDELPDDVTEVVVVCERGPRAVAWAREHADTDPALRATVLLGGMQAWRRG